MRRGATVASVLATLATASLTAASPARAFRTFADDPFCVEEGCTASGVPQARMPVPFELDRAGSADLPFAAVERAVTEAFADWSEPACTSLEVRYDGATSTGVVWGDDHGVVKWVESGWAALGHSRFELGVTTHHLTYTGGRWVIGSADVELNGVDYEWHLETTSPFDGQATVGDVVRHEAGHVMGLDHPCEFGIAGAPECDAIGPSLGPTPVMWPRSRDGGRDVLQPDDVAAICWQYPAVASGCPAVACPSGQVCISGACRAEPPPGVDAGPTPDGPDGSIPDGDAGAGWWDDLEPDGGRLDARVDGPPPPPTGTKSGGCSVAGGSPWPAALGLMLIVVVGGRSVRRLRS